MLGANIDEWKCFAEHGGQIKAYMDGEQMALRFFAMDGKSSLARMAYFNLDEERGQIEMKIAMLIHGFYLAIKFPNGKPDA